MTKKKATHLRQDVKDHTFNAQSPYNNNNNHNHKKEKETPIAVSKPNMDQDANEKLQNLKSLNALLLKETIEKRQQVESLEQAREALEAELTRFHQERKDLEADLMREGVENLSLELEKSVFNVFVDTQIRDMCNGVRDLSTMCVEPEKVNDEKVLECSELRKRFDELVGVVERERMVLNDVRREKDLLKSECDSWAVKANNLKETLNEIEDVKRNLEVRCEKLKKEHEKLVGEKEDGERAVRAVEKERDGARDSLAQALEEIDGLKRKAEELVREKRDIEGEKMGMEMKISKLEQEVGMLNETVSGLRKEDEKLRDKVVEMEKRCEDATIKESDMVREISKLNKEKEERDSNIRMLEEEKDSVKQLLKIAEETLEEKEQLVASIAKKKLEVEEANYCKESEIAGLVKEVGQLRSARSALELSCQKLKNENKDLLSEISSYRDALDRETKERDSVQRCLEEVRADLMNVRSKANETGKQLEVVMEELGQVKNEKEILIKESKEIESRLASLTKEKELLEKNLLDAQKVAEAMKAKIELAGSKSERTLSILKDTAALLSASKDVDRDIKMDATNGENVGEDCEAYVKELVAIKNAFQAKESLVQDLKRQLEYLQDSVIKAEKKKGFWTLLSSATTLFAAVSIAYLARGR